MPIPSILKDIFWKIPFLSEKEKEKIFYAIKANLRSEKATIDNSNRAEVLECYVKQVLMNPIYQDNDFKAIIMSLIKEKTAILRLLRIIFLKCIPLRKTMPGGERE